MVFYATEPVERRGVENGKSRGEVFSAGDVRIAPSRQANATSAKGLCAVGSATFAPNALLYGYRHLSAELGRWVNRDPIQEKGGVNVYAFVDNSTLSRWDLLGLLKVCCSDVRGPWYERMFRHCHIADSCGHGEEAFDIWTDSSCDRKLDDGTDCCCASKDDIQACMRRYPYSSAPRGPQDGWCDYIGNNCQTSVILTLGHCCLKSNYIPDWYAGPPRGRCLEYRGRFGVGVLVGPTPRVCVRWEVPDWRDQNPPEDDDPRVPPAFPRPERPPAP